MKDFSEHHRPACAPPRRRATALLAWGLLLAASLAAQSNVGAVRGTVLDPSRAILVGAQVSLENPLTGRQIQLASNEQGQFDFENVPYGAYRLRVQAPGWAPWSEPISVHTSVPALVTAVLSLEVARQSLTVKAPANLVQGETPETTTVVDSTSLQLTAAPDRSDALQAAVATTPGWSTEDDGLLHTRGDDDGALYVIDGVPNPDRMDALFAAAFDTESVSSLQVINGHIPAEFGDRAGAVIIVQPKSGLETPFTATAAVGGGSFDSAEVSSTLAGGTRRWGVFLAGSTRRSDRYLDPVDPRNFNNSGGAGTLFLRSDWRPSQRDTLILDASGGGADFRVPNDLLQELDGQRQSQQLRDDGESLSWQHTWSADALSNLAWFRHAYHGRLNGSPFDTPLLAGQNRHHARQGATAALSYARHGQNLKVGAEGTRASIAEQFSFAVTDSQAGQAADLSPAALAFTPANPFFFAGRIVRGAGAGYAQDDFSPLKNLAVSAGVRYDDSALLVRDHQLSPRLGGIYYLSRTKTALRASWDRLYMPPQLENLLLASSPQARQLSPFAASAGDGGAAIPPEKVWALEGGFSQELPGTLRLDASYWRRWFRNIDDPNIFFSTTVIFPNSVAQARAQGVDVRLDMPERHGFSAGLSYANSRITEIGPLNGGLFLSQDFLAIGPGTAFTPDHDQRNVGSFAVTYRRAPRNLWTSFSGRYESGVPIEIPDSELGSLSALPGVTLVDLARQRVRPWAVFGWSGGADLLHHERITLRGQLDVQNLANRAFVYNFANPFSGTHFGYPRMVAGRLVFSFTR